MNEFPRIYVGGVSLPRLIVGSNWFLGYSHTSLAKDRLIRKWQTREQVTAILIAFLNEGVDAVMCPPSQLMEEAVQQAEQVVGRRMIRIVTPIFNIQPGGPFESEPEVMLDECLRLNATFCMPHQAVTDALLDRMSGEIRDLGKYTAMIRERGMIPGLSTHMPESVVYADRMQADVETYIQIYNAAGFLMQVEVDWVNRIIHEAQKPVMTIKPLAAGRLQPLVGLAFVWSTLRSQDMVTIGTSSPEEACEVVEISRSLLANQAPAYELQRTRSKLSLA
jgi:hypothetical protein